MSCLTRVASSATKSRSRITTLRSPLSKRLLESQLWLPHTRKVLDEEEQEQEPIQAKDELIQAKDDTILELRLALKDIEVGDRELSRPTDPARIRWAVPLARIYGVLPLPCPSCGGPMKILAFLTDPSVVSNILLHLDLHHLPSPLSPARGPAQGDFLFDQTSRFDATDAEPEPDQRFASVPSCSIGRCRMNSQTDDRKRCSNPGSPPASTP